MGDFEKQGAEFEAKAEKKMKGWGMFGSKWDEAADLLEKAANSYKLGKCWQKAAGAFIKLADCQFKMESKHEAASCYVDAANCYKKTDLTEAVNMLDKACGIFMETGRLSMAARHFKDMGEILEKDEKTEAAMQAFEKAADLYQGEEVTSTGSQCRLKVAQMAAQLEQYPKAIEIFEAVGREALDSNLLKYSVKNHLLSAGLCHLCGKDPVAIHNALDKYRDVDPTFQNTREYKLLSDLVDAVDELNVEKFTDVIKEFDGISRLDQWKTTLLLRAKNALKAQEEAEDQLT